MRDSPPSSPWISIGSHRASWLDRVVEGGFRFAVYVSLNDFALFFLIFSFHSSSSTAFEEKFEEEYVRYLVCFEIWSIFLKN